MPVADHHSAPFTRGYRWMKHPRGVSESRNRRLAESTRISNELGQAGQIRRPQERRFRQWCPETCPLSPVTRNISSISILEASPINVEKRRGLRP